MKVEYKKVFAADSDIEFSETEFLERVGLEGWILCLVRDYSDGITYYFYRNEPSMKIGHEGTGEK